MSVVRVFPSEVIGKIKPVHGVGQPPFSGTFGTFDFSMFSRLTEAGIPFSRLHDVKGYYGNFRFVDIPNLFRDFDADPEKEENYDFVWTDMLLTELEKAGVEPFFRLGVTIENQAPIKAYRIFPPKDPKKWAIICEHVIRHYTEGWANGYHMNIRYWEIWNEPEDHPCSKSQMWLGTAEEYFRLYEVASKHLKEKFPHLKIGGYSGCGFYSLTPPADETPQSRKDNRYRVEYFNRFLAYVKEHNCPLDFFSFHCYDVAENAKVHFEYARRRLDEEGFANTEISMNEWNADYQKRATAFHAASCAEFILAMQNGPIDTGMFYDARFDTSIFGGLFSPLDGSNFLTYYDFMMFNELYKMGAQIRVACDGEDIPCCAAKAPDGKIAVMAVNHTNHPVPFVLDGIIPDRNVRIIAHRKPYVGMRFPKALPPESVILITGKAK